MLWQKEKGQDRGLGVLSWGPDAGLNEVISVGLIEQMRLEQSLKGSEGGSPVRILGLLGQWFSISSDSSLLPRGLLPMSGDIFTCHNCVCVYIGGHAAGF